METSNDTTLEPTWHGIVHKLQTRYPDARIDTQYFKTTVTKYFKSKLCKRVWRGQTFRTLSGLKWKEVINKPADELIISKFSHRATDSGDEYVYLVNGASPIVLTKTGNDVKVTVAGHHFGKVVDDLVSAMRIATHGKLCELRQSAACSRYLSSFLASQTCPRCNRNKTKQENKENLPSEKGMPRIVQATIIRCFCIHLISTFIFYQISLLELSVCWSKNMLWIRVIVG